MNFIKPLDILFIFVFTLLVVYDYFPTISLADAIPKGVLSSLILVILAVSLLFKRYRETNNKEIFQWQIFFTIYILLLLGLLTALGGQSTSGVAFDNGVLWIVLLLSLFDIYSQWKKLKKSEV